MPRLVGLWKHKPLKVLWCLQKLSWEHESCGLDAVHQHRKRHRLKTPGLKGSGWTVFALRTPKSLLVVARSWVDT